jgi:siroheme synthase-like protein
MALTDAGARPGALTRHYPVFLDLAGRPCVVIGGGAVAERKVEGLVAAGAEVAVVSPELTAALAELAAAGRIRHVPRGYRRGDLAGFQLAFVATDDRGVNALVASEGHGRGVPVNAADDPEHCDFILPAVLRRGGVVIAVGTGGASPALAAVIRDEIARQITEEHAALLEIAAAARADLLATGTPASAAAWRAALRDPELRRLAREGASDDARQRLLSCLGEGS